MEEGWVKLDEKINKGQHYFCSMEPRNTRRDKLLFGSVKPGETQPNTCEVTRSNRSVELKNVIIL